MHHLTVRFRVGFVIPDFMLPPRLFQISDVVRHFSPGCFFYHTS